MTLQVLTITNSQTTVKNTANNVRAKVAYTHDDSIDHFIVNGTWIVQDQGLQPVTFLQGNESGDLIVTMHDIPNGKVYGTLEDGRFKGWTLDTGPFASKLRATTQTRSH